MDDPVDPNPTVTVTPPSGTRFPLGTTTVTVRAIDARNNTTTATFTVPVTAPVSTPTPTTLTPTPTTPSPTPTPTPSPTPTPTPSPTPTPKPPHVTGIAKGTRSKKGLTTITVAFVEAFALVSAGNSSLYTLKGGVKKRGKTSYTKGVGIKSVSYDRSANKVTITLAKPFKGAVQVTVHGGAMATTGASSCGDSVAIVQ